MHDEELQAWKKEIEKQDIPAERIEGAIAAGLKQARQRRQRNKQKFQKRIMWTVMAAAVLMLAFVTSIRVSPAFASAIASIPGMAGIVERIQDNKGLQLAIENDHYQAVGASEEADGVSVTLEGLITDEAGMVVFSKVKTGRNSRELSMPSIQVVDENGIPLSRHSSSQTSWSDGGDYILTNVAEFEFEDGLPQEAFIEYEVTDWKGEEEVTTVRIPFKLDLQPIKKEQYILNETAIVEGQKIRIRSVTVGTLKTAVEVEVDPHNTMEIFGFEDLRLMDENGDVWSSIKDGVSGRGTDDPNVAIYYLQSNYFKKSDHLTLAFDKLMALEKEQASVVIDMEKGKILKQPSDARFNLLLAEERRLKVHFRAEEGYYRDPFSVAFDADGKELHMNSGTYSGNENDRQIELELQDGGYKNPITLPLYGYPSYIEGHVEMKVK